MPRLASFCWNPSDDEVVSLLKEARDNPDPIGFHIGPFAALWGTKEDAQFVMGRAAFLAPLIRAPGSLFRKVFPTLTYPGRKEDPAAKQVGKAMRTFAHAHARWLTHMSRLQARWSEEFGSLARVLDLQENPTTGKADLFYGKFFPDPGNRDHYVEGPFHVMDVLSHPAHFNLSPIQREAVLSLGFIVKQQIDLYARILKALKSEAYMEGLTPAERENYQTFLSLIPDSEIYSLESFSKQLEKALNKAGRIPKEALFSAKASDRYSIIVPYSVRGIAANPSLWQTLKNLFFGKREPTTVEFADPSPSLRPEVERGSPFIAPYRRHVRPAPGVPVPLTYTSKLAPGFERTFSLPLKSQMEMQKQDWDETLEQAYDLPRAVYVDPDESTWLSLHRNAEFFGVVQGFAELARTGVPIPWTLPVKALSQLVNYQGKDKRLIQGQSKANLPSAQARLYSLAEQISVQPGDELTPRLREVVSRRLTTLTGAPAKTDKHIVVISRPNEFLERLAEFRDAYRQRLIEIQDEIAEEWGQRIPDMVPPSLQHLYQIVDGRTPSDYVKALRQAGILEEDVIEEMRLYAWKKLGERGFPYTPSDFSTIGSFLNNFKKTWGNRPIGFTPRIFSEAAPRAEGEPGHLARVPRNIFWQRRVYPADVANFIENQVNALSKQVGQDNDLVKSIKKMARSYNDAVRGMAAGDASAFLQQGGLYFVSVLGSNLTLGKANILLPREFRMSQLQALRTLNKYFWNMFRATRSKDSGAFFALKNFTEEEMRYWGAAINMPLIASDMVKTLHFSNLSLEQVEQLPAFAGSAFMKIHPIRWFKRAVIDRGQILFEGAIAVAMRSLMDGFRQAFPNATPEEKAIFINDIHTILGVLDARKQMVSPVQRDFENMWAYFSIRFVRAQMLAGLKILGELASARDPEARRMHHFRYTRFMASALGTYLFLYTALNLLTGRGTGQWDPDEPDFLGFSVKIGSGPGIIIAPGGWFRTMAFLAAMGMNTKEDPAYILRGDVPLHGDPDSIYKVLVHHPIFRFMSTKRAPINDVTTIPAFSVLVPIEALRPGGTVFPTPTDLTGTPLIASPEDFGWTIFQSLPMPFWPQAFGDIVYRQVPNLSINAAFEALIGAFGEALGVNASAYPASDALDEYLRRQTFADGTPRFPDGLATIPTEQNRLREFLDTDPMASALNRLWDWQRTHFSGVLSRERFAVLKRFERDVKERDALFDEGKIDGLRYRQEIARLVAAKRKDFEELAIESVRFEQEKSKLAKTVGAYYDLFEDPRVILAGEGTDSPVLDYDALEQLQEEYRREHPEIVPIVDAIEEYPGFDSLNYRNLNRIQNLLRRAGWWEAEDKAWADAISWYSSLFDPELKDYPSPASYIREYYGKKAATTEEAELLAIGLDRDPLIQRFEELRTQYRFQLLAKLPKHERDELRLLGLRYNYLDTSLADMLRIGLIE